MDILYGGGVLLCYVVLGVLVWRKFNSIFALIFPFVYGYTTVFFSCLYIELFPSEIYEQGVVSHFNGASFLLFLVLSFSVVSVVLTFQVFFKRFNYSSGDIKPLLPVSLLICVVLLEVFLIAHIMVSGSPLFSSGVTKFSFWREQALFKSLAVFNWLLYPIVFVVGSSGAYFLYNKKRLASILSFVVLVLACFYYVSWGNKFSALLLVVFFYFIPGLVSFRVRFGKKFPIFRRTFFMSLFFLFAVGILVMGQYEKFQSRGLDVEEQLVERVLVLQGHVWWGGVNEVLSFGGDYQHVLDEFKSIFVGGEVGEAGMSYIMKRLAPAGLFSSYVESGVEFTGGYPAIAILTLGLVGGALVSAFSWGIFGVFLFYLWRLISQGSRFRLFFAAYIYMTSISWFQHGSVNGFINWKFFVVMLVLLTMEFLKWRISFRGFQTHKEVCGV